MSDKLTPLPFPFLLEHTLSEIRKNRFMGIPGSLFYYPREDDPFGMVRYGRRLETPFGAAAGPHTQMAQNIVAAWLCGARYIELKTIQTLDNLSISRPCIDMQDEGYNCEWSQELTTGQSYREYLHAWILIHLLRRELGFPGDTGTLFNMSVGYNLEGILQNNVQEFIRKMRDCSAEREEARALVRTLCPEHAQAEIPSCISDHVTLSTMHGCPPGEIGRIGQYLIRDLRLHTTIKLNPTLLGAGPLRELLNGKLGFTTEVPDQAFEHDLNYDDAVAILRNLQAAATDAGVAFGVKLTNTLECLNHRDIFPREEKMMYMSGRALHPVSVALAARLQEEFGGQLDISFSAGADAFNLPDLLASGLKPVTVCTDLLKPGGYGRLHQYVENLRTDFATVNAGSTGEFILKRAGMTDDAPGAALRNLKDYAGRVAGSPAYARGEDTEPSIKTERPLGWFDCIHAPCVDTCPTNQDIPEYMRRTAAGDPEGALRAVFQTNPFPTVTGMICDHPCQQKCTRIHYDEPLRIREIKRNAASSGAGPEKPAWLPDGRKGRAAIIGAGPAGLSCAWFLKMAGFETDVYEAKSLTGGMVSAAIPRFRLTSESIGRDTERILASGVNLLKDKQVDREHFDTLRREYDAVFIAAGAQRSAIPRLPGIDADGVLDPLAFLFDPEGHRGIMRGRTVLIIGGGNTAMDAARTAFRLVGESGSVKIVYRRTVKEMPADRGEIRAVKQEGVEILELSSPVRIETQEGRVRALQCIRNVMSGKGSDGRNRPVPLEGSEFSIPCDLVIPATGQEPAFDFADPAMLKPEPGSFRTALPGVFIGGDALHGAATAIRAIGDGRKAAMEILGVVAGEAEFQRQADGELLHRKAVRQWGPSLKETEPAGRRNFDLVLEPFTSEEAREEASRCLSCDTICHVCVSVCPNLANYGFEIEPVVFSLQKAKRGDDGSILLLPDREFAVQQRYQVLNIRDLCNECGNCTTFCPSAGRPFADKPGVCLSIDSLREEGSGFFLTRHTDRSVLVRKDGEHIRTLTLQGDRYIYETDQVRAVFRKEDFQAEEVKFLVPCVREFRFDFAAEMSVVMAGAMAFSDPAHTVTGL